MKGIYKKFLSAVLSSLSLPKDMAFCDSAKASGSEAKAFEVHLNMFREN